MKLTVFAATGGIGKLIVAQAVEAGHDVTAAVRDPAKLTDDVDHVQVDLADPDPARMIEAVTGADAVLSALGPRGKAELGVAARGTRAIADAMRAAGTRRLLVVSAAPMGTVPSPARPNPPKHDPGDGFVMRHLMAPLVKAALRHHYADLAAMEDAVFASGLDWTVVRPPRLVDKPVTGVYREAFGRNVRGGSTISRADVAHHMLAMIERPEAIRQTTAVAY